MKLLNGTLYDLRVTRRAPGGKNATATTLVWPEMAEGMVLDAIRVQMQQYALSGSPHPLLVEIEESE